MLSSLLITYSSQNTNVNKIYFFTYLFFCVAFLIVFGGKMQKAIH